MFIEKYSNSSIKALKSFADGLKRDIDAVENAVAYNFSNGIVEGTNSRLKMIKRSMYGRCEYSCAISSHKNIQELKKKDLYRRKINE